ITGAAFACGSSNSEIERIRARCFILKKVYRYQLPGINRTTQVIGLTSCTFLPSPFPIRSPDWSFCVAQTINFRFSDALVTCSRCQIGYIDKRENNFANPDAILQTAFELFTALGQRRFTGTDIGKELELHSRGVADFSC